MDNKLYDRLAKKELERKLKSSGCVLIQGPKFSGKSTLCSLYAKSTLKLNNKNTIELAKIDPKYTLIGDYPRLIDQWQKVPDIWNEIINNLNEDYEFGRFLITGSTTPLNPEELYHSGAGRITTLTLRPLSLYESNESKGIVSLTSLFKNNDNFPTLFKDDNNLSINDIAFLICRGGWPISLKADKEYQLDVTKNYFEGLFNTENESDEFFHFLKNKNIELLKIILKSFARNISTDTKKSKMIKNIIESSIRDTLDEDTFDCYKETLKNLYLIYELPATNFNLRTSVAIRNTPKIHFFDTSIATCSLNITPSDLLNDLHSFGLLFEDFALRDLEVYSSSINAKLSHYRDSSNLEVDVILTLPNGDYGAIEIKIASEENINLGISSLNKFEKKILKSNLKPPSFKLILVSHGACYKTKDNIYVVPINYLKP